MISNPSCLFTLLVGSGGSRARARYQGSQSMRTYVCTAFVYASSVLRVPRVHRLTRVRNGRRVINVYSARPTLSSRARQQRAIATSRSYTNLHTTNLANRDHWKQMHARFAARCRYSACARKCGARRARRPRTLPHNMGAHPRGWPRTLWARHARDAAQPTHNAPLAEETKT